MVLNQSFSKQHHSLDPPTIGTLALHWLEEVLPAGIDLLGDSEAICERETVERNRSPVSYHTDFRHEASAVTLVNHCCDAANLVP
jgi:hypothetical protein